MDAISGIFEQLGGPTAISNATGFPLTTVHSWKRSGFVPRWRVPALLDLAQRLDVGLTADDFPDRAVQSTDGGRVGHIANRKSAGAAGSPGKIVETSPKVVA